MKLLLTLTLLCIYAISMRAMHDIDRQLAITMRECNELLSLSHEKSLSEEAKNEVEKQYSKACKLLFQLQKTRRLKEKRELLEQSLTFDDLVDAVNNRTAMKYYLFPISSVQREQLLNRAKAIFEEDQQHYRKSKQVLENLKCPSEALNQETLKEEYASAVQKSENLQRELEEIKGHYKMTTSAHQSSNSTSDSDKEESNSSYSME